MKLQKIPFLSERIFDVPESPLSEEELNIKYNFEPKLGEVKRHIINELSRAINDPERFFLSEDEGFPLFHEVTGEFYWADSWYDDDGEDLILAQSLVLVDQAKENYAGLELLVYLSNESGEITYDDGFNISVV